MPSVPFFKFRFTPSWTMVFLTLLFVGLFLRLGFWQIHRAEEKEQMLAAEKRQASLKPVLWTPKQKLPLQYTPIKIAGRYLPEVFFLDNQHHQHQFGYHVLSPLELADGSVVIIDRGWIPGDMTRRIFPKITAPKNLIQVRGTTYFPSKGQWVLGQDYEKKENSVVILERLDEQLLSQLLQKSVYPFIIRLDKQDTHGFVREWATVSMPPQRHLAYALQWFAMASVILIIFVALNLKKRNEDTVQ
ncbi:MAG: SURF1 family protein [Legionella sp.]|uniref:SURF1 family protein n=1 Tax=Legionella sp. TaxID=459 RepID=UPI002850A783|nr:SURF1 family protein [Legionella sp.]